ncbi:hypothetical protein [Flavobacterium soli]|uniref:hypothetical protein n=1 Tax=Flavobacterium soli TaxID=344881 RepID=UPI0012F769B4
MAVSKSKRPAPQGQAIPIAFRQQAAVPYLSLDLKIHFRKSVTIKLAMAPTAASTTVLAISSEKILGMMLRSVPEAVPILRVVSDSNISLRFTVIDGNLADCRDDATDNDNVARDGHQCGR